MRSVGAMIDVNPAIETGNNVMGDVVLCLQWVVFASGQGAHQEYGTAATTGISATLEKEVSVLCREFHNSLGVQEVPDDAPVVWFWKARQSPHWIVTQVVRAPQQPGQRIAYEYFSIALSEGDLHALGNNPLRAIELIGVDTLREQWIRGQREPVDVTVKNSHITSSVTQHTITPQFSQGGTWPATTENHRALLSYLNSGERGKQTFASWWPEAKSPPASVFDIVLRSDETRVARPHEILAVATELNHDLSRNLPSPPSYDTVGGRSYRALLHSAEEVQTMLSEAYLPAALEESPHRWMTRPHKLAGLCQKIADALPEYVARLSEPLSAENERLCAELAGDYKELGQELQKLRHPNMLHQSHVFARERTTSPTGQPQAGAEGISSKSGPMTFLLAGLLALCLLGFGVRTLVSKSSFNPATPAVGIRLSNSGDDQRDQQAMALMRTRADKSVFRVARDLAVKRAREGKTLSKNAMQNIVVDAIAQAMLQTPHAQITPVQKQFLYRMTTTPIRTKALNGVKAGIRQSRR